MNSGGSNPDPLLRALGFVTGIGIYFGACLAVGLGLGLLAAHFLGGNAFVVLAGILVGAMAGGSGVYRMVMRETSRQ